MKVFERAKRYFPFLWSEKQLRQLVKSGKLTAEEYEKITSEPYLDN